MYYVIIMIYIYITAATWFWINNKATLRDLLAVTGLESYSNWIQITLLFSPRNIMDSKSNRAPIWCYVKLCLLFQSHQWIQTEVTAWKCSIQVKKIVSSDLEIWWMTLKNHSTLFLCYFKLCVNCSYSLETLSSAENLWFFVLCDLEIWQMTLKNNRPPLLCYIKLCAPLCSHLWIQTGVTLWKWRNWVKIGNYWSCVTLKFDRWP